MRKSIISMLLLLFISACDDIPSEVVENNFGSIRALNITVPDPYEPKSNSDEFVVTTQLNNNSNLDSIWYSVLWTNDNSKVIKKVYLLDNGEQGDQTKNDKLYTGKTSLLNDKTSGRYKIEVFTLDKDREKSLLAIKYFIIKALGANIPPVLSELSIVDKVARETSFNWSIKVTDENGLSDISKVLFFLDRPDGTSVNTDGFEMNDTGDSNLGDQNAGDGIYSFKNIFSSTAQTGTWKFTFKAIDKSGAESNIITHNLVVE